MEYRTGRTLIQSGKKQGPGKKGHLGWETFGPHYRSASGPKSRNEEGLGEARDSLRTEPI